MPRIKFIFIIIGLLIGSLLIYNIPETKPVTADPLPGSSEEEVSFAGGISQSCPISDEAEPSVPDWPDERGDWQEVPLPHGLLSSFIPKAQAAEEMCTTGTLVVQLHVRGAPVQCGVMSPRKTDPALRQANIFVAFYSPDNPNVRGNAKTDAYGRAIFRKVPMGSNGKLRVRLQTWGPYNGFKYTYEKAVIKPEITIKPGQTVWDIVGEHAFPAPRKVAKQLIVPAYPPARPMMMDQRIINAIVAGNNPGLTIDFGRFRKRDIFEGVTTDVGPAINYPTDNYNFSNRVLITNYPTLIDSDRHAVLRGLKQTGYFAAPTVQQKREAWQKAYNANPQQYRSYFVSIWEAEEKTKFESVSRLKFVLMRNLEDLIVHHGNISTPAMPKILDETLAIFMAIYKDARGDPKKIKPDYMPWVETFVGKDKKQQQRFFARYQELDDILNDRIGVKDITADTISSLKLIYRGIHFGTRVVNALSRARALRAGPKEVTPYEGEGKELVPILKPDQATLAKATKEQTALAQNQPTALAQKVNTPSQTGGPLVRPKPGEINGYPAIAGGTGDPDPNAIPLPKKPCPVPTQKTPPFKGKVPLVLSALTMKELQ